MREAYAPLNKRLNSQVQAQQDDCVARQHSTWAQSRRKGSWKRGCQAEGWFPLGGVSKAPVERQHLKYALKGGGHQGFPDLTWLVPSKELKKKENVVVRKAPSTYWAEVRCPYFNSLPLTHRHTLIWHLLVLLSLSWNTLMSFHFLPTEKICKGERNLRKRAEGHQANTLPHSRCLFTSLDTYKNLLMLMEWEWVSHLSNITQT